MIPKFIVPIICVLIIPTHGQVGAGLAGSKQPSQSRLRHKAALDHVYGSMFNLFLTHLRMLQINTHKITIGLHLDVETNNIVKNATLFNNIVKTEATAPAPRFVTTDKEGHGNLYNDRVTIQLYYECLCPDCRKFDTTSFKNTVLELGPFLDVHTYPYGNAKSIVNKNGSVEFICQHGPAECYGNKLHACAIDLLRDTTSAVLYNSCLMDYSQAGKGSDDRAADMCGIQMGINSEAIKQCARGARGSQLLKLFGDESKKVGFRSVPHILINGVVGRDDHFKEDVCKAFKYPPQQCLQ